MLIDDKYRNHKVFNRLKVYGEFYKTLSESIFGFITQGTESIVNIDTYLFSSIQGTLESIHNTLYSGRINDAYSLLRNYYESVIINTYTNLYLEDNFSFENFVVEKINNWVKGIEKLPNYRQMSSYIRNSEKLLRINELLYSKNDVYKVIRNRCNDHTHYNFYRYAIYNDNELILENRIIYLEHLFNDVGNIFVLHLTYLFYLKDHYMMGSDYIDYLDLGLTPEEGSQYLVAPFIQNIFDTEMKTKRMDLYLEIKNHTPMFLS
jgi:hypothetical protein